MNHHEIVQSGPVFNKFGDVYRGPALWHEWWAPVMWPMVSACEFCGGHITQQERHGPWHHTALGEGK